ncbi:hypothetical protein ACFVGB_003408 [Salmonella enterica]|uniref:Uncharacterized protein n=1 Tax=Salmonella enterica TaxID=28901 RepID=A0A760RNQ2_SALER|nr:hypothetical protein [Salmonella enterica]EHM5604847.1 hypothetical protein [Salmonella enterica subsp. enterica serovar Urbana]EHM9714397.1 hypothetical protein [Salmonella enterica subsp. enterica serovar Oranienburg]EKC4220842.1 hypothetical protein [Salmonella enterica subsp. enterica]EEC6816334.1 hypothetical protein [Salmonella enterica]EEF9708821.1 hypothetical protein [Salmonella enterica]
MMNKRQKKALANMVSAMALSAMAPVPANSLGYSDIAGLNDTGPSVIMRSLDESNVYMDISEATTHTIELTNRMRFHLKTMREEWEEKRIPIHIDKNDTRPRKYVFALLGAQIKNCKFYTEAVKIALNKPEAKKDELLRADIIAFGKAVAGLRFVAEEFLSFIEQTHPPKAVSSEPLGLSDSALKALIASEHKSLGLSAPVFEV